MKILYCDPIDVESFDCISICEWFNAPRRFYRGVRVEVEDEVEAHVLDFPRPGKVQILVPSGVAVQAPGPSFGGVSLLKQRFRMEVANFLFFPRSSEK